MTQKNDRRRRVLADTKIQGLLCLRIAIYWVICQIIVVGTIFGFINLEGIANVPNGSFWRFVTPALFVSAMALPIALLDMLIFSNRFVGPIYNFRRRFNLLANSSGVDELHFRRGDFYPDLSKNFNKLRSRLQSAVPERLSKDTEHTPQESSVANQSCLESVK